MIGFIARLFARAEPVLAEAGPRDAAVLATLHSGSFRRGWSETEFERLLTDKSVIAHHATIARDHVGFILSRRAAGEAEILSVAIDAEYRGRGLGHRLLDLHLRRLAGLAVHTVFLEVEQDNVAACRLYARAGFTEVARRPGYYPGGGNQAAIALVLRREL